MGPQDRKRPLHRRALKITAGSFPKCEISSKSWGRRKWDSTWYSITDRNLTLRYRWIASSHRKIQFNDCGFKVWGTNWDANKLWPENILQRILYERKLTLFWIERRQFANNVLHISLRYTGICIFCLVKRKLTETRATIFASFLPLLSRSYGYYISFETES